MAITSYQHGVNLPPQTKLFAGVCFPRETFFFKLTHYRNVSEIFDNAITSIVLGIEDFETGTDARMLPV